MIQPFVLLWHEMPAGSAIASHWDLMIQSGDRLATWRLSGDWSKIPRQTVEQIGDHRLEYLDFQGPLAGDRGTVRQIARGEFHVHRWTDNDIAGEIHGKGEVNALQLMRIDNRTLWTLEVTQDPTKPGQV